MSKTIGLVLLLTATCLAGEARMQVCIDTNPVSGWVALKDTVAECPIKETTGQGICLRFRGDSGNVKIKAILLRWIWCDLGSPDIHDTCALAFILDPVLYEIKPGWRYFMFKENRNTTTADSNDSLLTWVDQAHYDFCVYFTKKHPIADSLQHMQYTQLPGFIDYGHLMSSAWDSLVACQLVIVTDTAKYTQVQAKVTQVPKVVRQLTGQKFDVMGRLIPKQTVNKTKFFLIR